MPRHLGPPQGKHRCLSMPRHLGRPRGKHTCLSMPGHLNPQPGKHRCLSMPRHLGPPPGKHRCLSMPRHLDPPPGKHRCLSTVVPVTSFLPKRSFAKPMPKHPRVHSRLRRKLNFSGRGVQYNTLCMQRRRHRKGASERSRTQANRIECKEQ